MAEQEQDKQYTLNDPSINMKRLLLIVSFLAGSLYCFSRQKKSDITSLLVALYSAKEPSEKAAVLTAYGEKNNLVLAKQYLSPYKDITRIPSDTLIYRALELDRRSANKKVEADCYFTLWCKASKEDRIAMMILNSLHRYI